MSEVSDTPDPVGDPEPVEVALLQEHGEQWQIEHIDGGKWLAIERPVARLARFYVADSASQLRDLLDNDPILRRGFLQARSLCVALRRCQCDHSRSSRLIYREVARKAAQALVSWVAPCGRSMACHSGAGGCDGNRVGSRWRARSPTRVA